MRPTLPLLFAFASIATAQLKVRQVHLGHITDEELPDACKSRCQLVIANYNSCQSRTDPGCFCTQASLASFETCGNCMLALEQATLEEVADVQETYTALNNVCSALGKPLSTITASATAGSTVSGPVAAAGLDPERNSAHRPPTALMAVPFMLFVLLVRTTVL